MLWDCLGNPDPFSRWLSGFQLLYLLLLKQVGFLNTVYEYGLGGAVGSVFIGQRRPRQPAQVFFFFLYPGAQ